MIAVQLTTTIRAGVPSHGKPFGNALATLRTGLRRSSGVDLQHHAPGTFSLGTQHAHKEAPSGIADGLGERMVAYHPLDVQLLDDDLVVLVHQGTGRLVGEVQPRPLHLEMGFRQQLTGLAAAVAPLDPTRQPPLRSSQLPLGSPVQPGIGDTRPIRERGEALQPHIHPNSLSGWRQGFGRNVTGDVGVPAISLAHDGAGFGRTLQGTVTHDTHRPDLGQHEASALQMRPVAPLAIGEAVVPALAAKAGIPGGLTSFDAAKEAVEGVLEAVQHVLKHLGVDALELVPGLFELRQSRALAGKVQRFAALGVGGLALGKGVVVEAAAGL